MGQQLLRRMQAGTALQGDAQNVRILSASAASLAASVGVVHEPFTSWRFSSVAPRATAQPFQT